MDEHKTEYSLIVTIVNRGYSDEVMDAAREAGAQGGTILYSRGAGIHETETFFGISIQPEKELVMILAKEEIRAAILQAIVHKTGLNREGRGLSFSLPVSAVSGICHLNSEGNP